MTIGVHFDTYKVTHFFHCFILQQRASTQVGAQTGLVGNSLVAAVQPLAQAQPTSFFTGSAPPAQAHPSHPAAQQAPAPHQSAGAAAGAAGSTNFYNSLNSLQTTLQGTHGAIQPPTPTLQPVAIQLPPSAAPPAPAPAPAPQPQLQFQSQTAGANTQLSHSQPPSLALPSQHTQLPPQQRVNARPTTLVGFPVERKPMPTIIPQEHPNLATLTAAPQSGGNEHLFQHQQPRALSPKSSDMQQHVDAKPFSPNRQQAPVMSRHAMQPPQFQQQPQQPPQHPQPVIHQQAGPIVSKQDLSLSARMDMAMHPSSAPPPIWSATTQLSTTQPNMPVYTQAQSVPQAVTKSVIATQPTSTVQSRTPGITSSMRPTVPPPPIQPSNVPTNVPPPPPRGPRPGSGRMPFQNQTYITHPMGHVIRLPAPSGVNVNNRFRAPSPQTSMPMPPRSVPPPPVMSTVAGAPPSTLPTSTPIATSKPTPKPNLASTAPPSSTTSTTTKKFGPGPSPAMMRPGGKNSGPKSNLGRVPRGPQLSPEEMKAKQASEREALLASTKAFFAPREGSKAEDSKSGDAKKNDNEDGKK